MPPVDLASAPSTGAPDGLSAPPLTAARVTGWGGGPTTPVSVARAGSAEALRAALRQRSPGLAGSGAIARGMGRSYGDAAQLRLGLALDTRALNGFELDPERGIVRAQAGVTLGRLLAALAPAGWVLPVVPGTQHVTVGGAIAADIHGKNHGAVGTFGAHVRGLCLLTGGGEVLELTPEHDRELLLATIGGMGLTGVILEAEVALHRLPDGTGAMLSVDTDRVTRLDDALAILDGPGGPHRVAWLDLLGRSAVRGVVTRAQLGGESPEGPSADTSASASATVAARLRIPPRWPAGLLRPEVVRAYNAYRFRATPRRARAVPEPFGVHMFPLDVLDAWPRLYGPAGFVQYQLVVPRGAEDALERVIERLRRSPVPCYLAVLKDFGEQSEAPLSFPLRGWTLALDLPRVVPDLWALLDGFDELVAQAGGRVYLAKDGRLRADALAAMYPRLQQWRAVRERIDPEHVWRSDLGVRTGLVDGPR